MLLTLARTRPAKWVGGTAAAATIALLVSVIWYAAATDDAVSIGEYVDQEPEQPSDYVVTPVAMLTAEHNAVWNRRPGEDLFAGQRFELMHGFAEVTTVRGAVVVVEAPATIELLHNPNALHLHSGKLVGRCETAASKGFVVKTNQADIVDLGTEFGVGVDEAGEVSVRVFDGLVEVAAADDPDGKQAMGANELARIESGQMQRVAFDINLDFHRDLPTRRSVPQVVGQVRWLSSSPPSIYEHELVDPDSAYLFLEKADAHVSAGTVLFQSQGLRETEIDGRIEVKKDTQVDVYMLHFDAVKKFESATGKKMMVGQGTVQGQIVFDRPIVGVIGSYLQLRATQAQYADPAIKYGYKPQRGPEKGEVQIGPDGRTLTFNLNSSPGDLDQMRILVASEGERPRRDESDESNLF